MSKFLKKSDPSSPKLTDCDTKVLSLLTMNGREGTLIKFKQTITNEPRALSLGPFQIRSEVYQQDAQ